MSAPDPLTAAIKAIVEQEVAPVRAELAELRARVASQPHKLVSREVAAEHLGISLPTVDRYIRQGLLRAQKVRRRVLVDLSSMPDARDLAARAKHGLSISGG